MLAATFITQNKVSVIAVLCIDDSSHVTTISYSVTTIDNTIKYTKF